MSNRKTSSETKMLNALDYIIQNFQDHNIIGLGEGAHGLVNAHMFFQEIFDNKKLQETIDVVIVEFANINYQDILDKFILGEKVDINELRKVWRESTQSPNGFGEAPVYLELLQKIRSVNLTLPEGKKIRVLAGDPPIDWKLINTADEYIRSLALRRALPAQLAIEYGINLSQKVLIIYSGFHLTKVNDEKIYPNPDHHTITSVVNRQYPNAMKVIEVLNPPSQKLEELTKKLPMNSIIELSLNEIGNFPAKNFFTSVFNKNGERVTLFNKYKIRDLFDAFLYLGPSETWKISKAAFFETEYMNEINRRRKLIGSEPFDEA